MEKDTVRTISNGKSRKWESRDQAKMYYLQLAGLCRGRRKAEIYEYPCAVSKGYEGMQ